MRRSSSEAVGEWTLPGLCIERFSHQTGFSSLPSEMTLKMPRLRHAERQLLGERVERVDVSDLSRISGTLIRERVAAGETVSDLLYPRTEALLRELGFFDTLRAI